MSFDRLRALSHLQRISSHADRPRFEIPLESLAPRAGRYAQAHNELGTTLEREMIRAAREPEPEPDRVISRTRTDTGRAIPFDRVRAPVRRGFRPERVIEGRRYLFNRALNAWELAHV